jgi:hypothetical protein
MCPSRSSIELGIAIVFLKIGESSLGFFDA